MREEWRRYRDRIKRSTGERMGDKKRGGSFREERFRKAK